jgi:hypothetical protein
MKEIIYDLKECESTEDFMNVLEVEQENIIKWYVSKSFHKNQSDTLAVLFKIFTKKKFIKALKKLIKSDNINSDFAIIISGFINKFRSDESMREIKELYLNLLPNLLKKKIAKLVKKTHVDEKAALELLAAVPTTNLYDNESQISHYCRIICTKLYLLSSHEVVVKEADDLRKLFKILFGEEFFHYVAVSILLEKKDRISNSNESQIKMWNMLTDFALNALESFEKKDIKNALKLYVEKREKDKTADHDGARRTSLLSISGEIYPTLASVIKKLSKDDEIKKYL